MAENEIPLVNKVAPQTWDAIRRKSAQTLPNRPSEQGYSAEEIKRRFYELVTGANSSALGEIDRVVEEINAYVTALKEILDTFMAEASLKQPFKQNITADMWALNEELGQYEIWVTPENHGVPDYRELAVEFYLQYADKLVRTNQFDIYTNGNVRLYSNNTDIGFVTIARNRDGYIVSKNTVQAEKVTGLSKVGKTNDYGDLDNLPNLAQMSMNEIMISRILSGQQKVGAAANADNAENAQYAVQAATATKAYNADASDKAAKDGDGVNIKENYAKQNGTYPNMTVGNASNAGNATKATQDGNGANIAETYAKITGGGTYPNMTVGNATNAANATKATQDGNGANIVNTYATKAALATTDSTATAANTAAAAAQTTANAAVAKSGGTMTGGLTISANTAGSSTGGALNVSAGGARIQGALYANGGIYI